MQKFRFATEADAEALVAIYAPYVLETTVTFEYTVPTVEEFAARIRTFQEHYPYIVCEEDGELIGYAYAHRYNERAAYTWDAEVSVYVDKNKRYGGVGSKLYDKVIRMLGLQKVRNVYSSITGENDISVSMHQKAGFSYIATFPKTGYKFDRWLDLIWMGICLAIPEEPPEPFKSIHEVNSEILERILEK